MGEEQDGLQAELRMEQEERLALERELTEVRAAVSDTQQELEEIRNRSSSLANNENERNTVLDAKRQLEEELLELKSECHLAVRSKDKAEKDLTFEQEVRR